MISSHEFLEILQMSFNIKLIANLKSTNYQETFYH